jgi:hypothetical protein
VRATDWTPADAHARRMRTLLLGALLVSGCAPSVRMPEIAPAEIETTLLLIGDGGEQDPRHPGAPLDSLFAHASLAPQRTVIVFLGDNIYPGGVPIDSGAAHWADALRRLQVQVDAVPHGARAIFVPGNHDWAYHEPEGLQSIRMQERLIASLARGGDIVQLPTNGCPGPIPVDVGRLRLVLLDTQWFLHPYIVRDSLSSCPTDVGVVTDMLRQQVRPTREDQVVVVAAHHPLMTGGKHGGYCGVTGQYNRFAGSPQDILSGTNRLMRDSLLSAFVEYPPLVYAAGHEHNLQVLRGQQASFLLVSGAGSHSKAGCAVHLRESLFIAQHRSGFMKLDILRGRGVLLSVYHFARDGAGGLAYTRWLEPGP